MTQRMNPELWERIKKQIMREEVAGTKADQWSARKAQLAVKRYKEAGGGYKGKKSPENPLSIWTGQDWRTKSGKPSSETGERYLPSKMIEALTEAQYKRTSAKKRSDTKKGIQFSKQPKDIADYLRRFA